MEQFSKMKPKSEFVGGDKNNVLFSNKYVKVIDYDGWTIVTESDFVVCIPYLIDSNQIILRHEYIPTFKFVDGQEHHITILSGAIEKGETPEKAITRELEEEAGIVLSPEYKIEFLKPLFISKGNANKYYPCIIQLTEGQYHEVIPSGDGSKAEKKSQSVKVDAKYVNSINSSDLITEYMVLKLKEYLNM